MTITIEGVVKKKGFMDRVCSFCNELMILFMVIIDWIKTGSSDLISFFRGRETNGGINHG